jgi:hypothetical protein
MKGRGGRLTIQNVAILMGFEGEALARTVATPALVKSLVRQGRSVGREMIARKWDDLRVLGPPSPGGSGNSDLKRLAQ